MVQLEEKIMGMSTGLMIMKQKDSTEDWKVGYIWQPQNTHSFFELGKHSKVTPFSVRKQRGPPLVFSNELPVGQAEDESEPQVPS